MTDEEMSQEEFDIILDVVGRFFEPLVPEIERRKCFAEYFCRWLWDEGLFIGISEEDPDPAEGFDVEEELEKAA